MGDEDVLGLDIPMDQAGCVGGGQCLEDRLEQDEGCSVVNGPY